MENSKCVDCAQNVRPRQHSLPCTYCGSLTHQCYSKRLHMDSDEYRKYKLVELSVIFQCKSCATKASAPYESKVLFLKSSSVDVQVRMYILYSAILYLIITVILRQFVQMKVLVSNKLINIFRSLTKCLFSDELINIFRSLTKSEVIMKQE